MMVRKLMMPAVLISTLLPTAVAAAAGDAARGKVVFARCAACHSMDRVRKTTGPHLADLTGRKAGTLAGYAFSPAMKKYGQVWDAKTIDAFLAAPSKVVPGTKMVFMGLPKAEDRADLIAYLKTPK